MRQNYRVLRILPALCVALAGCSFWGGCARPGYSSVVAEVRDADGQPTANGTTVTIREPGGYEATAMGYGDRSQVQVYVGEDDRTGPFTVEVTKPYFTSAKVDNVRTPTDRCGITEAASVRLTLTLLSDAPPVRQVVVPKGPYGYSVGNYEDKVTAYVEAAPGVSREVIWSSSDPSVITVTPDGHTKTVCRTVPGSATLTATSVADPTKRGVLEVLAAAVPPASEWCL